MSVGDTVTILASYGQFYYIQAGSDRGFVLKSNVGILIWETTKSTRNNRFGHIAQDLLHSGMKNTVTTADPNNPNNSIGIPMIGAQTEIQIRNASLQIDWTDTSKTATEHKARWMGLCEDKVTDSSMLTVVKSMVDRFYSGTGTEYEHATLSATVKNDNATALFVNVTKTAVDSVLKRFQGNMDKLLYVHRETYSDQEKAARDNHPVQAAILNTNPVDLPLYKSFDKGLAMALHALWSAKIELTNFSASGGRYSGTLVYTFYDHFGLNKDDVTTFAPAGFIRGFQSWYILQRYEIFNGAYRPFVTKVTFTENISGTY